MKVESFKLCALCSVGVATKDVYSALPFRLLISAADIVREIAMDALACIPLLASLALDFKRFPMTELTKKLERIPWMTA